jgi:predicted phosphodiesterase
MRVAVLSDIHSNFYALEKVLAHAQELGVERYWVLGDLVGYGPHPEKCVAWFQKEYRHIDWVMGNHDAMLMAWDIREQIVRKPKTADRLRQLNILALNELRDVEESNPKQKTIRINDVIPALLLNKKTLSSHPKLDKFYRRTFSSDHYGPKLVLAQDVEFWIVHASRRDGRQLGEYIYPWSSLLLKRELEALVTVYNQKQNSEGFLSWLRPTLRFNRPICQFHGHSHVPYILALDESNANGNWKPVCAEPERPQPLGRALTIVAPGSVGQPRNGDRRACYALLDTNAKEVTFYRIEYDEKKTSMEMKRLGYSSHLQERLDSAKYPSGDDAPSEEWIDCMKSLSNWKSK